MEDMENVEDNEYLTFLFDATDHWWKKYSILNDLTSFTTLITMRQVQYGWSSKIYNRKFCTINFRIRLLKQKMLAMPMPTPQTCKATSIFGLESRISDTDSELTDSRLPTWTSRQVLGLCKNCAF